MPQRSIGRFRTLAEARQIIGEFIARYNTQWLIERLGQVTPRSGAGWGRAAGSLTMRAPKTGPRIRSGCEISAETIARYPPK